jgi:NAD(P)-dependent dehydrogenase (short-subunit alcohol dehydrogenase family)
LGRATALALAARGDRVILACRSEDKALEAMDAVAAATGSDQLEFLELDLSDLDQVRVAAGAMLDRGDPIHLLVANAGIAAQKGVTAQGFELAFGVNHLGHFLFVTELLPLLREGSPAPDGAPARVVVVSSGSHFDAKKGIDFDALRQPTTSVSGMPEYAVSKLANVLFVQELARRTDPDELYVVALHPGNLIGTDVMRRVPRPLESLIKRFRPSPEEGARTTVMCATSAEVLAHRGDYYSVMELKEPSALATPELAAELWQRSEQWTAPASA